MALLLANSSYCLRYLVLRNIMNRDGSDPEVIELEGLREEDPLFLSLVRDQEPNGSWTRLDGTAHLPAVRYTALALSRLGYLGFGPDHPAVQRGAQYLFGIQREDGSWQMPQVGGSEEDRGYSMIPLQTALPLQGLAASGFAKDSKAEKAYDWLLAQRLPDGAWPTGIAGARAAAGERGVYGRVGGYRRLAHSKWGCRSNTTGVLVSLSLHPSRRSGQEARRALDLLLGRETKEAHTLGFEAARAIGFEPAHGFLAYYARYDLALILDLCGRIGADRGDARIAEIIEFVTGLRGPHGLWDYPPNPQVGYWLTYDLIRSLSCLDESGDWISLEPRTPFKAYPKRSKRY